jgi:hypothetical protein
MAIHFDTTQAQFRNMPFGREQMKQKVAREMKFIGAEPRVNRAAPTPN